MSFARLSHLVFENSRPATFRYPPYGFMGDVLADIGVKDLYGDESYKAVRVTTFDLGGQRGKNLKILISALPALPDAAVGLLSTDLFLQYDVDLDFGAQRLNYF